MLNVLLLTASVGAQVQRGQEGFRQRDVRFLVDLFWHWQSALAQRHLLGDVHNTQIQRYLNDLAASSFASKLRGKGPPRYRLTRGGFVGLIRELRELALSREFDAYVFASYFLESYRTRIAHFIEGEGNPMPLSYRREIQLLMDTGELRTRKIEALERELEYWSQRTQEIRQVVALVRKGGKTLGELAREIERRFPYELNHQKPLSVLLRESPEDLARWELGEGNELRAKMVWEPKRAAIEAQLRWLKSR